MLYLATTKEQRLALADYVRKCGKFIPPRIFNQFIRDSAEYSEKLFWFQNKVWEVGKENVEQNLIGRIASSALEESDFRAFVETVTQLNVPMANDIIENMAE
jgi:ubiquinone biosynthesis protein UbiJ